MDFEAFSEVLEAALAAAPLPPITLDRQPRHASVVGIFRPSPCPREGLPAGHPELLFIRRAEVEGDPWSGHVAFPGGRMDPEDDGPWGAALREVREELGLELAPLGRRLGELPNQLTLPLMGRRMVVHPYVVAARELPPLTPNDEVARVLWVPLRDLLDGVGRDTMTWEWQGQSLVLPCRRLEGEVLWGMTLRMVEDLLRIWRRAFVEG